MSYHLLKGDFESSKAVLGAENQSTRFDASFQNCRLQPPAGAAVLKVDRIKACGRTRWFLQQLRRILLMWPQSFR